MVIDTITSTKTPVAILWIEAEKGRKQIDIPKWIEIVWDVTDEVAYDTFTMCSKDYQIPEDDLKNLQLWSPEDEVL